MSTEPVALNVNPTTGAPLLRRVLTGENAARYGPLPMVPLPADNELLIAWVRDVADIVKDKGIYRRDKVVVVPFYEERRLEVMDPEAFCSWCQRHFVGVKTKYDQNGDPFEVCKDMPVELAKKTLLSYDFFPVIPKIRTVAPAAMPALEDGKLVLLREGFHEGRGLFVFPSDFGDYGEIPLQEACDYLRKIHQRFPFSDWHEFDRGEDEYFEAGTIKQSRSLAVQIAAMLSQFAAFLLPPGSNRMGFIYNANAQRSGKSLLCKIALMPLYGFFRGQAWKTDEAELHKTLDAEVLAGSRYLAFDNLRGRLANQALEGLMTSPDWTGRVLGRTEMFTAPNELSLFVTGNSLITSSDMSHRCLMCDLFVEEGDVQEREIPADLVIDEPWLKESSNRRMILTSLWSIVRNWYVAGMPKASDYGHKPRLGFERWGEIIGGMVAFAGFGNCLEKTRIEGAGDSENENALRLLEVLNSERINPEIDKLSLPDAESREFKFQQLVDICYHDGIFEWLLDGRIEDDHFRLRPDATSKLGKMLARYAPGAESRERHRVFSVSSGSEPVRLKFFTTGIGRKKRYVISL